MKLFKAFGFEVRVDASWLLLALLVTWSLAEGLFPNTYEGLAPATYWWMGAIGALGLFASIIVHELMHSLVARNYGLPIRGITLFLFGGVADMEEEPHSPRAEFFVALAGPAASVGVAGLSALLAAAGRAYQWPVPVVGLLAWGAGINFILVLFNLVPAFPLDGGRLLRSALWRWKGNLRWATRFTATIGSAFGLFLIVTGVFSIVAGQFIGGMWWFLIGLFLRNAARSSFRQLLVRQVLEDQPVHRFMNTDVEIVPARTTVSAFVDDYVYHQHHKMYPVDDDGGVRGCVTTRRIKEIPRDQWTATTVGDIADPPSEQTTVAPNADALQVLTRLSKSNRSRLMVMDRGHLVGILTLKDLMKFIALKLELEEDVNPSDIGTVADV